MSLVTDLIKEVSTLRREVDQQNATLNTFLRSQHDNMAMIRAELHGGRSGHVDRMLASLEAAEDSSKKAVAALQRASQALARVEMI